MTSAAAVVTATARHAWHPCPISILSGISRFSWRHPRSSPASASTSALPRPKALSTSTTSIPTTPLRHIAIVGAGPAGLYTATALRKKLPDAHIDLFEAHATPYGLVRYGVAPDHPEVANVTHQFDALVSNDPHIRVMTSCPVYGEMPAGGPAGRAGLPLDRLQQHYDATVLAYGGAGADRALGVPGEDGVPSRILSARAFVNWYNGRPRSAASASLGDASDVEIAPPALDCTSVVIVGHGNVALDAARILLKAPSSLAATDMPSSRVAYLAEHSRVRHVHLVGRRGPWQTAFTTPSLRELLTLMKNDGIAFRTNPERFWFWDKARTPAETASRANQRRVDLLRKAVDASVTTLKPGCSVPEKEPDRTCTFHFGLAPRAFTFSKQADSDVPIQAVFDHQEPRPVHADPSDPASPVIRINVGTRDVVGSPPPSPDGLTVGTTTLPCGLVLKAVGYRAQPLPFTPSNPTRAPFIFDTRRSRVPNAGDGQVVRSADDPTPVPGLYVVGWLKHGPVGTIASTWRDALQTASTILAAHDPAAKAAPSTGSPAKGGWPALEADVAQTNPALHAQWRPWTAWKRIEAAELARGATQQPAKPREKLLSEAAMHRVADGGLPHDADFV